MFALVTHEGPKTTKGDGVPVCVFAHVKSCFLGGEAGGGGKDWAGGGA